MPIKAPVTIRFAEIKKLFVEPVSLSQYWEKTEIITRIIENISKLGRASITFEELRLITTADYRASSTGFLAACLLAGRRRGKCVFSS